jgi:hypothetical protein
VLTRRLLSLLATAAIGVVGALAFASPADAHAVKPSGSADCQSIGQYLVTWKIENDWNPPRNVTDAHAEITSIDRTLNGVSLGTHIEVHESVTGTELVTGKPGDTLTLIVSATWPADGFEDNDKTATVTLGNDCPSPKPSPRVPSPAASSPASGGGGGLPVTGAPTIAFAGVALVLIAGGVLLVLLGRRRRGAA